LTAVETSLENIFQQNEGISEQTLILDDILDDLTQVKADLTAVDGKVDGLDS